MFLLQLLRYLKGYVHFRARGVFLERFLNLAARDRIPIWNGKKHGTEYSGSVGASHYSRLRRHAKKTNTRMRIVEKRGVPFHRRRYRKRTGLAIGFALFALFLFAMSRFIWQIDVHGNQSIEETRILEALDELGIHPGTLRMRVDVRGAERRLLMNIGELSWAALNIEGSHLRVEVKESAPPPEMVDPDRPCNIIAAYSGQITTLRVYEGQSMVMEGQAVLEGDILVSGVMQDRMGQHRFKHALADIYAQVQQELVVEVPLDQTEYRETGEIRTRRYLQIFSFDFPLFWPSKPPLPYRIERLAKPLRVASVTLPVGIFEETYIFMKAVPVVYSEQQAKELALRELKALELAEMDNAEVETRSMTGKLEGEYYVLRANYVCNRNIAQKKEFYIGG